MTEAASHLAPVVIVVPLLAGCVLLAVGDRWGRRFVDLLSLAAAVAVTVLDAVLLGVARSGAVVTWAGGWSPRHGVTVGIALVVDQFGAGMALLAGVLVSCALLYSWRYYDDIQGHFQILFLLFLAGMSGFALSGDLFNMLVFFELMGACAYALTAVRIEDRAAVQGGFNFGVINSAGAYLTLTGVALLYAHTGQLGLPQLSQALAGHRPTVLIAVAYVLVITGWLVKAAAAPFHFWTADAEAVAPSPVCAVLSGAMVTMGVYGVARVYWTVFRRALPEAPVQHLLLTIGVLTAVVGMVMCPMQRNIKRMLAYSTIAHVGLFLTMLAALSPDGLAGAALYVFGHAGVKGSLFLLTGVVLNRYGSVDEVELHGRGHPGLLAWLFVIDALALAALPPFGTALGKDVGEHALVVAGQPWAPALFVAVSAMTGGAVLRAAGGVFFGAGHRPARKDGSDSADEMSGEDAPETSGRLRRIPSPMILAIGTLMTGALAVGVVPGTASSVLRAATRFTDSRGYVERALDGRVAAVASGSLDWTTSGVLLGVLSAVLAVGIAAAGWYGDRLPDAVTALAGAGRPLVRVLRRAHSGHVGDYVAWLAVGVAVMLLIVAVPVAR